MGWTILVFLCLGYAILRAIKRGNKAQQIMISPDLFVMRDGDSYRVEIVRKSPEAKAALRVIWNELTPMQRTDLARQFETDGVS
jgi:hypothetical protein